LSSNEQSGLTTYSDGANGESVPPQLHCEVQAAHIEGGGRAESEIL